MRFTWPWAKPHNNYVLLVLFIVTAQAAGLLGSLFTFSAIPTWYAALSKPFFSPPNFLFGPVWTVLYTLMGISAYLVWRKAQFKPRARNFWRSYLIQLLLNALWSLIFFGAKLPGLALLEITLLWFFIYRSIRFAYPFDRAAAYLLYPYLAWVSFATLLNAAIYVLN